MNQTSFAELGVPAPLVEALAADGITTAFAIQTLALPDGLAGRDVCGKAKTGSGKTLAFGLPLLARVSKAAPRRPTGLVLVPTRELALQVAGVLEKLGPAVQREVVAVFGGADMARQRSALAGGADVVVATPGRLIDLADQGAVSLEQVEVLVLDEADRMVDMGFLPQVQWLLRRMRRERQTLLFSATLDGAIEHLVRDEMHDPARHEVASPTLTVEQMTHRFLLVHEMDKARVAARIVQEEGRALLFVRTKRMADRLAAELLGLGVDAAAIHGDLYQRQREKALASFAAGTLPALVATDVAARGLHIDDVGCVVHYDPADDHKAYLHRSGRTARAGEHGLVVTLLLWNEELEVKRLQKRIGLAVPIVRIFSNDPRLGDLAGWEPQPGEAVGARA